MKNGPHPDHVREWVIAATAPAKLLVVDDDSHILEMFRDLAKHWNCTVRTCTDGATAVDWVRREDFRLVFLDLRMPGMDGVEVFHRIKSMKPKCPVAVLSGYLDAQVISEVQNMGFAIFIAKPFALYGDFFHQLFNIFGITRLPCAKGC